MSDQVTRRAFLAAAGAAGAAWVAADPALVHAALEHARHTAATPPPYQFAALTAAQAAGLEAVAMRILPSDETPGAKEAGVIHFMDKALSTYATSRKASVFKGLDDLNKRARTKWPGTTSFATLSPERQEPERLAACIDDERSRAALPRGDVDRTGAVGEAKRCQEDRSPRVLGGSCDEDRRRVEVRAADAAPDQWPGHRPATRQR